MTAHCERGDEYVVGQLAHTYKYEGGGAAVLGSIQPQPIENALDGTVPLEKIAAAIKPIDNHFAHTCLLALENTINGRVLPERYVREAVALAHGHGLSEHHSDTHPGIPPPAHMRAIPKHRRAIPPSLIWPVFTPA